MTNLKTAVFVAASFVVLAAIALVIFVAVAQVVPVSAVTPSGPPLDVPGQPIATFSP